jgi:menaquinone-dependent protoporphyrinogen oxidase
MTGKVLVTYSTRTGSTKGATECIREKLSDRGENTDIAPMQEVTDISQYSAVIAGSAIQAGKWFPEAMTFIQTHQHELKNKSFAAFLVCMTLAMPKGNSYRGTVSSWLKPVRDIVKPVSEGLFIGTLDLNKIPSFSDSLKFRISIMTGVWKEGDHRDWDSIEKWTKDLKTLLDGVGKENS